MKQFLLLLAVLYFSTAIYGKADHSWLDKLVAKGARNGCVRGHTMYGKTDEERMDLTIKATKPCEELYWKILQELKDARE